LFFFNKRKGLTNEDIIGNWSLMRANTFICCMYAFKGSNIVGFGENWAAFRINSGHDELKQLGDYALIICGVNRFFESFDIARVECNFKLQGYVDYRDLYIQEVADTVSDNLISFHFTKDPLKTTDCFELIKDIMYKYQQEYRFVVHTECSFEDTLDEYRGNIKTDGIKIEIEDCKSHSFICSTADILSRTLCCKWENDKFEAGFLRENR